MDADPPVGVAAPELPDALPAPSEPRDDIDREGDTDYGEQEERSDRYLEGQDADPALREEGGRNIDQATA